MQGNFAVNHLKRKKKSFKNWHSFISRKCGGCKYIDWKNTMNKSTFPAILAC